ncbi:MAG: hypothetical protein PHE54_04555 [Bacilli bacterium]|nr:hypothetical protein [Bacilli bacterium]
MGKELPKKIVSANFIESAFEYIDSGTEGAIYWNGYNDNQTVLKLFYELMPSFTKENKIIKLQVLAEIADRHYLPAEKPVSTMSDDEEYVGYEMTTPYQHGDNPFFKNLDDLFLMGTKMQCFEALSATNENLKILHGLKIYVNDLKTANILLDGDLKPTFCDIDSFLVPGIPQTDDDIFYTNSLFEQLYPNTCLTPINNDRFMLGLMSLNYFMDNNDLIYTPTMELFESLTSMATINRNGKNILKAILSDSLDKPYISELLKELDPEQELFSKDKIRDMVRN